MAPQLQPMPLKMLSVTVHPTNPMSTEVILVAVPSTLAPNQILIKIYSAASNPKDWLHLVSRDLHYNSGDDLAGMVVGVGTSVTRFQPGDRVAAFHRMLAPYGAYAEYGIVDSHTTFRIPPSLSFSEASTMPLVTTTAAITLFRRQKFTAPWDLPMTTSSMADATKISAKPLLIYAASTALGAFTIKLAKAAGIGPIIAIGGDSSAYIKTLLDLDTTSPGTSDLFLDRHSGWAKIKDQVEKMVTSRNLTLSHGIDAQSDDDSWIHLSQILGGLSHSERATLSVFSGTRTYNDPSIPANVDIIYTFVGTAHEAAYRPSMPRQPNPEEVIGDRDFAMRLFEWLEPSTADGSFSAHPFEIVPGGLHGVAQGLQTLRDGKAGGKKLVYEVVKQ